MRKQSVITRFAACLLVLAVAGWGQQPEKVPVQNEPYSTPERRAAIAERLDRPEREKRLQPERILATLGIKPGQRVADIGTGTGLLLPYLSRAVSPGGVVYAEDIFPDFLERARARAQKLNLENVVLVLGDEKNPRLPPGEIDLAVMLDAYHHFEYPKVMLDNIRGALKPEGRIAIVDFFKKGDRRDHVRLDREDVLKEVESFGWKLDGSPEALSDQYILIFRRKPN